MPEKKSFITGLLLAAAKVGSKLLTVFLKLMKSSKFLLGGASFLSYGICYGWTFTILFLPCLIIHEFGHVWAMRHTGLKTKGFYLIPFLGAAAVPEENFHNREQETFIAMMGPVFGVGSVIVLLLLYSLTGWEQLIAMAPIISLMNIFNLFPIHPLDGGRVFKSILMSIHSRLGLAFFVVGLVMSILLVGKLGFGLYVFIFILGAMELWRDYSDARKNLNIKPQMNPIKILVSVITYALTAITLSMLMYYSSIVAGSYQHIKEMLS